VLLEIKKESTWPVLNPSLGPKEMSDLKNIYIIRIPSLVLLRRYQELVPYCLIFY
jgi:hypothetical protein